MIASQMDDSTKVPASLQSSSDSTEQPKIKLMYRGNATEISAPLQPSFDSTEQPKIKLIYRGNTFDYIPRPVVVSEEDKKDWKTVTLIYRGNTFERKIPPPKPYQKPRAINWRWRFN